MIQSLIVFMSFIHSKILPQRNQFLGELRNEIHFRFFINTIFLDYRVFMVLNQRLSPFLTFFKVFIQSDISTVTSLCFHRTFRFRINFTRGFLIFIKSNNIFQMFLLDIIQSIKYSTRVIFLKLLFFTNFSRNLVNLWLIFSIIFFLLFDFLFTLPQLLYPFLF